MPKHQKGRASHEASPAPQRARSAEARPARAAPLRHLAPGAIVQRAMAAPQLLRPADLMALQRTIGNQAVNALLGSIGVQAKLIVNAPGDRYEREADRVAEQVLRMPAEPREATPAAQDPPAVMTKPAPGPGAAGSFAAGEDFAHQLDATRGSGRALPPAMRETFEGRFCADFSAVRLHADDLAGRLSGAIQAQAFTRGPDIYLGAGQSVSDSMAGQGLLAHELTHVVQQGAAPAKTSMSSQPVTEPGFPCRPISGQIQRKLAFENTNWSETKEVRVSKGGVGGALFVWDELVENTQHDKSLVVKSGEKASAEVMLGAELRPELKVSDWSIKAPRARFVSAEEAAIMQRFLHLSLKTDNWIPISKGQMKGERLINDITGGGTMVYEFAGGVELKDILQDKEVKTGESAFKIIQLLKQPNFVKTLGVMAVIDIFCGNYDRIVRPFDREIVANYDNLKIDLEQKIIYAIDNVDEKDTAKGAHIFLSPHLTEEQSWVNHDWTKHLRINRYGPIAYVAKKAILGALDLLNSKAAGEAKVLLDDTNFMISFVEGIQMGMSNLPGIVQGLSKENGPSVLATVNKRLSYLLNANQPWSNWVEPPRNSEYPTYNRRQAFVEGDLPQELNFYRDLDLDRARRIPLPVLPAHVPAAGITHVDNTRGERKRLDNRPWFYVPRQRDEFRHRLQSLETLQIISQTDREAMVGILAANLDYLVHTKVLTPRQRELLNENIRRDFFKVRRNLRAGDFSRWSLIGEMCELISVGALSPAKTHKHLVESDLFD
jgi:hypothetical protein